MSALAYGTGLAFPTARVLRLARAAVARRELRLDGLEVLTEAATGFYRVTPVLAALAGARRVVAVARSSVHGSARQAEAQVRDLAEAAGVSALVEVTTAPSWRVASTADVVTNLGAVRPIDARLARRLASPRAAVSLMFGAADARPADIDLAAVRAAGVPLAGVDERRIDLFRWTGQRVAWWLTEVGLEVPGARVVLWGEGPRAGPVERWLRGAGCHVAHAPLRPRLATLSNADALVLLEPPARLGPTSRPSARAVAEAAPGAAVLDLRGTADRAACEAAGLLVYPPEPPVRGHVGRTIGEILYAPVIELHAAGLRVGEVLSRARGRGFSRAACERLAVEEAPGERVPPRRPPPP